MSFFKKFFLVRMVYPYLDLKPTSLYFCALPKGQTLGKYLLNFLKVMLSCSTSGKMASFLVRQYSEHDVHMTLFSNGQSTY